MRNTNTSFLLLPIFFFAIAIGLSAAPMQLEAQDDVSSYPEAIPTDKPGVVISPFPPGRKLDVSGLEPGSLAMDPSVDKIFRIPGTHAGDSGQCGKHWRCLRGLHREKDG